MRKFILLENVGHILSVKMRGIMEYLFQAWCQIFSFSESPFFSPTDGGQEKSDHEVDHSQWAPAGGTRSSLSIPKLSIQFGHRLLFDFEVWRERCFILITVKGFNFFEVPLTRLTKPLNPYSLQPSFNARVPGLPLMQ